MKRKRYKPKYAVLCRLIDCEDDWGLFLLSDDGFLIGDASPKVFDTRAEARRAMRRNYRESAESYDAEWSVDGKDHCVRKVLPDEIALDVPIWDGENERDSWIRMRWEIVKL